MPYVIRGNAVYRADTGVLVGHSSDPKKYLRTLNMIEHGVKPKKKKKKRRT